MKNLNSQLVLTADHDQVFHLRQMIGNYWVSQKILQIEFIFYIVFGVWLGLFENKIWWVCLLTFSRQYWLVWQYWQRVWIYMVWPASLFVVLLFLCTSPCYWLLVWQYWQRVWKWFDPRLRTRVGELLVLLFLCTSPCSPSARLSACCRNQSFPENREKHHQKRSFDSELRRKSMLPTPRIQLPVRPFVREIIGWETEVYFCQLLQSFNPSTPLNQ